MSTNVNDPERDDEDLGAAGNEPLRDPERSDPVRKDAERPVGPDDPTSVDPSRIEGDPGEDAM